MQRYRINDRVAFRIHAPHGVTTNTSVGWLPMSVYRILLELGDGTTMREILTRVEAKRDRDALRDALELLIEARILVEIPESALVERRARSILRKEIFEHRPTLRLVQRALRTGRAVVIHDAFDPRFARRVHRALKTFSGLQPDMRLDLTENFHHRHFTIKQAGPLPPMLEQSEQLFNSSTVKTLIGRLAQADTRGPVGFAAAEYMPGDYALPHSDWDHNGSRTVSFVWHLTENWRPGWGGQLYWCASRTYLPPSFNTLVLFRLSEASAHMVCPVSPVARGRRLTVHGYWFRSGVSHFVPQTVSRRAKSKKTTSTIPARLGGESEEPLIISGR